MQPHHLGPTGGSDFDNNSQADSRCDAYDFACNHERRIDDCSSLDSKVRQHLRHDYTNPICGLNRVYDAFLDELEFNYRRVNCGS